MSTSADPDQPAASDSSTEAIHSVNDAGEKRSEGRYPWAKLGIVLILISGVLWFSLFAIPFLPLTTGKKALLAGVVFGGVQVAWWAGAALAGPRVAGMIRSLFRRRHRQTADEVDQSGSSSH